jgi:hypothetical protein
MRVAGGQPLPQVRGPQNKQSSSAGGSAEGESLLGAFPSTPSTRQVYRSTLSLCALLCSMQGRSSGPTTALLYQWQGG